MKSLWNIVFMLFVSLIAFNSYATTNEQILLWGDTYYGMTLKEVVLALPAVQIKSESTTALNLKTYEKVLASLDNLDISGEKFSVWFVFNNNKLSRVILSLHPQMKQTVAISTTEDINKLYAHYAELLTAKYGNPAKKSWQEYGPLNIRLLSTQWIKGLTNVELNVDKEQLNISYGAEYAEDLKKL